MSGMRRSHSFLLLACVCASQTIAIADDDKVAKLSPASERVRAWFPADTEAIVAASSFRIPGEGAAGAEKIGLATFAQLLACGELAELEKGKYLKPLTGKKIAHAMRGGRGFETVSAFGSHRSEACAVIVFDGQLGETAKEWTDLVRQGAKEVRMLAGREVFAFPSTVVMEGYVRPKPWQGTYLVLLSPDTLLCATSDKYLEEVLKRVDTPHADRALPDSLAEWRQVDASAPAWMVRHIPRAKGNRIIDGVTWSLKGDRIDIEYLPLENKADEVAAQARTRWRPDWVDLKSEFRRSADGSVIGTLNADLEDNPTLPLAMLLLYALQNESGAVGAQ